MGIKHKVSNAIERSVVRAYEKTDYDMVTEATGYFSGACLGAAFSTMDGFLAGHLAVSMVGVGALCGGTIAIANGLRKCRDGERKMRLMHAMRSSAS